MSSNASSKIRPLRILLIAATLVAIVGGSVWFFFGRGDNEPSFEPILASVTRGEFVSKVLDQGEVESSENVEIRCEVKARNGQITVISVVPEGTQVKEGDFLAQLDDTSFEKELESQNLAMATAQTKLIQAETALETARAAKREYVEGVYVEAIQTIENEIYDAQSQISTAKQELEQSIAVLEHSEKLHSKGFITSRQLSADKFSVEKAKIAIKKAENLLSLSNSKKKVLIEVTQEKELTKLEADIRAAAVDLSSQQKSLRVEEDKIREIRDQIASCKITVPPGVVGQVVYAKESGGRGGNDWVLEEGATVRQNQVIIRLPDPKNMQIKALINEQNITQIEQGMPALIQVDALDDVELTGIVTKVSQYAESKGWFGSNVRKYAVLIRIFDPPPTLKPGMNASVSIQARYDQSALQAPLQTVYSVQDKSFTLLKNGDRYVTREVTVDGNNSKMVVFTDGIEEGDQLVMNPGFYKERMELPEVLTDGRIELPNNVALVDGDSSNANSNAKDGAGRGPGQDQRTSNNGAPQTDSRGNGQRPSGDRAGRGGGRPDPSAMVSGMMQKYDTDGNGTIDATEMSSLEGRSRTFIEKADTDSDGSITRAELTTMASNMTSRSGGGGGGGRGPAPDAGNRKSAAPSTGAVQ